MYKVLLMNHEITLTFQSTVCSKCKYKIFALWLTNGASFLVMQGYECVCHSGWEGADCQQEIDECLSQPCKNNATCTDLLNNYWYVCGMARGHRPHKLHQSPYKCRIRGCSEIAICPSTSWGDNELQMAGKTNESINGSQQEKVPGEFVSHWRKKLLYLIGPMPCSRWGEVRRVEMLG